MCDGHASRAPRLVSSGGGRRNDVVLRAFLDDNTQVYTVENVKEQIHYEFFYTFYVTVVYCVLSALFAV